MDSLLAIRTASEGLEVSARTAGVDARVPSCPEWDVHALVLHTGTTHRWATTLVSTRATGYVEAELGEVPVEREGIFDWFEAGVILLVDVLESTDPETPVWSWADDHRARFWARRMAHETAVHGWDASHAAGMDRPIPAGVAADGIDEQLENVPFMVAFRPEVASLRGSGETIHLHATDTEGEWLIRLTEDGIEVSREHAKGDVAARGSASNLFLFLVGRIPPAELEVFGDAALLDRWQRDFSF
ncbi:MAG: maleylpyruvate isomerase family mycothiol-dependent enzyme [Acidimicrobiia bacterium]